MPAIDAIGQPVDFLAQRATLCMWCDPADKAGPADVIVVWEHPLGDGCWCTTGLHLSWACAAHARRERQDLRDLGFAVHAWVPTLAQYAPALPARPSYVIHAAHRRIGYDR